MKPIVRAFGLAGARRWSTTTLLLVTIASIALWGMTACSGTLPLISRQLADSPQLVQPLSLDEIYGAMPVGQVDTTEGEAVELGEAELIQLGESLYAMNCAPCHQANGEGNLNRFPALNNNALVTAQSPQPLIQTVLYGRGVMPTFAPTLSDQELVAVLSYIRQAWNNDAAPITAAQVRQIQERAISTTPPSN